MSKVVQQRNNSNFETSINVSWQLKVSCFFYVWNMTKILLGIKGTKLQIFFWDLLFCYWWKPYLYCSSQSRSLTKRRLPLVASKASWKIDWYRLALTRPLFNIGFEQFDSKVINQSLTTTLLNEVGWRANEAKLDCDLEAKLSIGVRLQFVSASFLKIN